MAEDHEPKPGKYDAITHLFIRDHILDDGSEPSSNALPFWLSPDITVIPPGGIPGDPVALQANEVRVRVTNDGGIEAVDAYVDVYAQFPSSVMTPDPSNRIGQGFVTVPAYGAANFAATWTPTPAEAGHRCLIARVQLFPQDVPVNLAAFDVAPDRHIAQRNVTVLFAGRSAKMEFQFFLVNPGDRPAATTVRVRATERAGLAGVAAALGSNLITFAREAAVTMSLHLGEPVRLAHVAEAERDVAKLARKQPAREGRNALSAKVPLPARAAVPGALTFTRRGAVPLPVPIEIAHLAERGELLGGMTVVLMP